MSTELAMVFVSAISSVFVALGGVWFGHVRAKEAEERADQRADKLMTAEAERADKQAKADIDKIREEHAHARTMWQAESEKARRQDERNRLQKDAAAYIELLGEVHEATAEMRDYVEQREELDDWDTYTEPPTRWNSEIRQRLAMMAAKLTLYGEEIRGAGTSARDHALLDAESWHRALQSKQGINHVIDLSMLTSGFAQTVSFRLEELDGDARSPQN